MDILSIQNYAKRQTDKLNLLYNIHNFAGRDIMGHNFRMSVGKIWEEFKCVVVYLPNNWVMYNRNVRIIF